MLSAKSIRKGKVMVAMPILIVPFLTLTFWGMGGGSVMNQKLVTDSGLNLQLPKAHLKDDSYENKLSFYEKADADSIKLANSIKNDPFLSSARNNDSTVFNQKSKNDGSYLQSTDPNEIKVYQKLAELNEQLNNAPQIKTKSDEPKDAQLEVSHTDDVKKLDHLLQNMNAENGSSSDDEDINKLDGLMEKIITIQHPERLTAHKDHGDTNTSVYQLDKLSTPSNITLLDTDKIIDGDNQNSFFGLNDNGSRIIPNTIEAVVHNEQSLTSGSIIKLRLLTDISISGSKIPKGSFLYGIATLHDERLDIDISSIRLGESLFPINISVYDLDGLPGIYVPGAITRDISKQSIANASHMMEVSSIDPSLKMQAANAGIDAAKNLLLKKVKLVKVTVKAGYKILLKENKNH